MARWIMYLYFMIVHLFAKIFNLMLGVILYLVYLDKM